MRSLKLFTYILLMLPAISVAQHASSLSDLLKHEAIFFNRANKRDMEVKSRLNRIVNDEKVDTVLVLLNRYMDAIKDSVKITRDDREYIVYREKGKVYVDYFFYPDASENSYEQRTKNAFDSGQAIFNYFVDHKIDTVTYKYKFDEHYKPAELAEFKGYINIKDDFYTLGYLPKSELDIVATDPRALFYIYILQTLRKAGY